MASDTSTSLPGVASRRVGDAMRIDLSGNWILLASHELEAKAAAIVSAGLQASFAVIDLGGVTQLDTAGAWVINRTRHELAHKGVSVSIEHARHEYDILLEEAHYRVLRAPAKPWTNPLIDALAELGASVSAAVKDLYAGVAFLGELMAALGHLALRPAKFRMTSLVYHIEGIGFRSIPIIALINFLVGAIVAQQGIYQLQRFGATTYAVDLIGILVLREMGVLLTSIMIAGRSGSAITAEIGSMKMREEIDALRVMGMSPIEVLIVPRVLALVISLPLLTFIADMAALFGGLLVSWSYGGISPAAFLSLLQAAISRNTFFVGIDKAPFMALVIGLIAAMEGLATQGSAESLGRQVTSSVVKSIFMVIVIDGLFAMFFTAIKY
jgi:phospholipid/cholesterol/gamma-HCH transport system permease protein